MQVIYRYDCYDRMFQIKYYIRYYVEYFLQGVPYTLNFCWSLKVMSFYLLW